jgi:hypothetical protein
LAPRKKPPLPALPPFDSFANPKQLAELLNGWTAERLVAVWNGLPGVEPTKGFKTAKNAASRIWERIQSLAEAAKPKVDKNAKGGAQAAKGKATKKATAAEKAPQAKAAAKAEETGPREGSKTAQVVAMLQRKKLGRL